MNPNSDVGSIPIARSIVDFGKFRDANQKLNGRQSTFGRISRLKMSLNRFSAASMLTGIGRES